MKKLITLTRELDCCDFCEGEQVCRRKCLYCKKDCCIDCEEGNLIRYYTFVYPSGSGAYGYSCYCNECENKLSKSKRSRTYNLYQIIKGLIKEKDDFFIDFDERVKRIENELVKLLKEKYSL